MGTGSFLGVKRPGRGADHSPPSSAGVKKEYIYTSRPLLDLGPWVWYGVTLPLPSTLTEPIYTSEFSTHSALFLILSQLLLHPPFSRQPHVCCRLQSKHDAASLVFWSVVLVAIATDDTNTHNKLLRRSMLCEIAAGQISKYDLGR
jgi:hypothetical protein